MLLNKSAIYVLAEFILFALFSFLAITFNTANADIVINGTRKVYLSNSNGVNVQVNNVGQSPSLVQLWIDDGDLNQKPSLSNAPFIITPPITRIDKEQGQAFRVLATPDAAKLPKDRETLFWLNVLDVPPKAENSENQNLLQIAVRSRIKLLYRPTSIKDQADNAPKQLEWTLSGNNLSVNNPTPFYITIRDVKERGSENKLNQAGFVVEPYSKEQVTLTQTPQINNLTYTYISDTGRSIENPLILKQN